jgi:hypothetical protein
MSYEVRIDGHLDQHWSTWFDGFTLTHEDNGATTLRGAVRDQSELHGLLDKIRDLGTTLISVTPVASPTNDEDGADARQQHVPPRASDIGGKEGGDRSLTEVSGPV